MSAAAMHRSLLMILLQQAKDDTFFAELLETLPVKEHEPLWQLALTRINDVAHSGILSASASPDEKVQHAQCAHFRSSAVFMLQLDSIKFLEAIVFIANLWISGKERRAPVSLLLSMETLHGSRESAQFKLLKRSLHRLCTGMLFDLMSVNTEATQKLCDDISRTCETFWTQNRAGRDGVLSNTITYVFMLSTAPTAKKVGEKPLLRLSLQF